jgi:hypothetical protein
MSRTNKDNTGARPIYILSAENKNCTARVNMQAHAELGDTARVNMQAHAELGDVLQSGGFSYKEVEGCFNNVRELSYLVVADRSLTLTRLLKLAKQFNQEALFAVGAGNEAAIIEIADPLNPHQLVGRFQRITEQEAKELPGWTRDGNQYWGVI